MNNYLLFLKPLITHKPQFYKICKERWKNCDQIFQVSRVVLINLHKRPLIGLVSFTLMHSRIFYTQSLDNRARLKLNWHNPTNSAGCGILTFFKRLFLRSNHTSSHHNLSTVKYWRTSDTWHVLEHGEQMEPWRYYSRRILSSLALLQKLQDVFVV